jgi:xylulokinase
MLPFYGPEITPRHDFAAPVRQGDPAFERGENPAAQIRALLEGQFLNMRLNSQWMECKVERIRLTGGASKNDGIARLVADVFQSPVERLDVTNSAALGAALIAAASAGHPLEALETAFCKAEPGSSLEPDRSLSGIYDDAMIRFQSLLRANGIA